MEDICEWARVLIASAIGGLFPLLGVVLTVKSERKRNCISIPICR